MFHANIKFISYICVLYGTSSVVSIFISLREAKFHLSFYNFPYEARSILPYSCLQKETIILYFRKFANFFANIFLTNNG